MATIITKTDTSRGFSPSVNIRRDFGSELVYIPTPNSRQTYDQILNSIHTNVRSFCIVGAYGTGKSAFILALEKQLNRKKPVFSKNWPEVKGLKSFEFKSIVGSFSSLVDTFAAEFGISMKTDYKIDDVVNRFEKYTNELQKTGKGLLLVIDEFGKYLEYASKNNPDRELYFIQQIAEIANDSRKNVVFITVLHQDFNGYSRNLTKTQQNEWSKVKGRLKELTFNEPVEQLLFLASERIASLGIGKGLKANSKLLAAIKHSKAFPLKDYLNEETASKLLPFDILSAAVLTLSLQEYGQNERSLFLFLESGDHLGLNHFEKRNQPYYNLSCVHDYLQYNYHSHLTTKYNKHFSQWAGIRNAVERVEAEPLLESRVDDAVKLVKTIGLLNIFASPAAQLDDEFICQYAEYSLGIKSPQQVLDILRKKQVQIVRFVSHSKRNILFEGTEIDIELAINAAGELVDQVTLVHPLLEKYFKNKYQSARAIQYKKGTPRFFRYHLSEEPEAIVPHGQIDGYINLIFGSDIKEKTILDYSKQCKEAVVFAWYKNSSEIKTLLYEIRKIEKVIENTKDDKIAQRELKSTLQHQVNLLNHYVKGDLFNEKGNVRWFYNGDKLQIRSSRDLNEQLSIVCDRVYCKTPYCPNEMLNKTNYSSAISTARKKLISQLIEKSGTENLGFEDDKFPPEKTIYLTLLRETGIHRETALGWRLEEPTEKSYKPLWDLCSEFLDSTQRGKRNLSELVDLLYERPFKLKRGLVDFWLPIWLLIKKDDYALFSDGFFVPELSADTIDLIVNNPSKYEIKAFDISGVRLDFFNGYRTILAQSKSDKPTKKSFVETIKPFVQFYKTLNSYTKQTKLISPKSQQLRNAIVTAKDPEISFFEEFPQALGFNLVTIQKNPDALASYFDALQAALKEIRSAYTSLIHRFEKLILDDFIGEKKGFKEYRITLQKRFAKLNQNLLLPHQQVFYNRLMLQIDERDAWLDALAIACVNKSLTEFQDKDEPILHERFREMVRSLDNLSELSEKDIDLTKEAVIKLEITSFVEGMQKSHIRLPKSKEKDLSILAKNINNKLSKDRNLNVLALLKLLQEQLKNE
jgi:hypothetical protein